MFYSGREDTETFTNAIVYIGYHETTIAPGQIAEAPPLTYAPSRLRYAESTCVSYARMNAQLGKTGFVRISGRGHYAEGGITFVLECVCDVQPVKASQDLATKMKPLMPG